MVDRRQGLTINTAVRACVVIAAAAGCSQVLGIHDWTPLDDSDASVAAGTGGSGQAGGGQAGGGSGGSAAGSAGVHAGGAGASGAGAGGAAGGGAAGAAGTCAQGQTACSGKCVSLTSDPDHCGTCNHACPSALHTNRGCSGGTCVSSCASGYDDCHDGGACDTALNTLTDCGQCGTACSLKNATATCAGGTCLIATCNTGYGNCSGMDSTGCETNTQTSAQHCGDCNTDCGTGGTCQAGICRYKGCAKLSVPHPGADAGMYPAGQVKVEFSPPVDLSKVTLTVRYYVATPETDSAPGSFQVFFTNDATNCFNGYYDYHPLTTVGWHSDTIDFSTVQTSVTNNCDDGGIGVVDLTHIAQLGFQINPGPNSPNPAIAFVDSVVLMGGPANVGPWNFDTSSSINPTTATGGSTIFHQTVGYNIMGTTLSWSTSCP